MENSEFDKSSVENINQKTFKNLVVVRIVGSGVPIPNCPVTPSVTIGTSRTTALEGLNKKKRHD